MKRSDLFFTFSLIPTDIIAILAGFSIAYFLRMASFEFIYLPPYPEFIRAVSYFIPLWIISFAASGLYSPRYILNNRISGLKLFWATASGLMLFVAIMFFTQEQFFSRLIVVYSLIVIYMCVLLMRYILLSLQRWVRKRFGLGIKKVILVGDSKLSMEIAAAMTRQHRKGYQIIGLVTAHELTDLSELGDTPYLGSLEKIGSIVAQEEPDELIVVDPRIDHNEKLNIIHLCEDKNVVFRFVPSLLTLYTKNNFAETFGNIPVFTLGRSSLQGWGRIAKRTIDIVGAIIGIIVSLPIQAITALVIKLTSPGPLFFIQERVGRDGNFRLYKFRSMHINAEEKHAEYIKKYGNMFKLKRDPRVTPIGHIIRKTSIDEIPQFYNVLLGHMSLVGPRPPMPIETLRYTREQKKRLGAVKPGITGLWQVSGRSDTNFDEWVKLDVYYIENWSLTLDISIIIRTIWVILFRRGAY